MNEFWRKEREAPNTLKSVQVFVFWMRTRRFWQYSSLLLIFWNTCITVWMITHALLGSSYNTGPEW